MLLLVSHTAVQPGLEVGTDEDAEGMVFLQNDIGIPADNNTVVSGFGDFPDDFPLTYKELGTHAVIEAKMRETVPESQLYIMPAVVTQHFTYLFRTHTLIFCEGFNDLFIIIVPAQMIREPFAELASAAAELSADCDNSHDPDLPLFTALLKTFTRKSNDAIISQGLLTFHRKIYFYFNALTNHFPTFPAFPSNP